MKYESIRMENCDFCDHVKGHLGVPMCKHAKEIRGAGSYTAINDIHFSPGSECPLRKMEQMKNKIEMMEELEI